MKLRTRSRGTRPEALKLTAEFPKHPLSDPDRWLVAQGAGFRVSHAQGAAFGVSHVFFRVYQVLGLLGGSRDLVSKVVSKISWSYK